MCQIGKHNLNADTQKSLFGPDFKIEKILGTQQENKNLLGMNGTGITENATKWSKNTKKIEKMNYFLLKF